MPSFCPLHACPRSRTATSSAVRQRVPDRRGTPRAGQAPSEGPSARPGGNIGHPGAQPRHQASAAGRSPRATVEGPAPKVLVLRSAAADLAVVGARWRSCRSGGDGATVPPAVPGRGLMAPG
ncbi:hypothetical protein DIZ27_14005 [Streptomyces sp. NWU339]|nr:hypothetical protein DIZ27_14005 [Streptomyces sp. NWU339]